MNPAPQNFEIRNSGGGTLNYQVETDQTWLSVSPNQGSSTGEADTIEVSINSEGLGEGTFQGIVTISDPSPSTLQATSAIIPVTLVVTPAVPGMPGPSIPRPAGPYFEPLLDGNSI